MKTLVEAKLNKEMTEYVEFKMNKRCLHQFKFFKM